MFVECPWVAMKALRGREGRVGERMGGAGREELYLLHILSNENVFCFVFFFFFNNWKIYKKQIEFLCQEGGGGLLKIKTLTLSPTPVPDMCY